MSEGDSSEKQFKIPKWGPRRLREILQLIEDAINVRTPKAGFGVTTSREPDGTLIHYQEAINAGIAANDSGGNSGSPIALYGANSGAPALFHLLQSSAPTALP